MREIEALNNLLHLLYAGYELALLDGDTHSGKEWNGKPNRSRMEITISELLNDKTITQQYRTEFQQPTKIGWEHLFIGKMASGRRQYWLNKTYWQLSIAHTIMEWGRACWSHRNIILYGERKDKYKITRLRLKAEAQVWMDAPRIEALIPIRQDQWNRKLLKKAAKSDIAFWLEHNRTTRQIVQRGAVSNILAALMQTEELTAANTSFLSKISHTKRMAIQDGQTDKGTNDMTEKNEELPG